MSNFIDLYKFWVDEPMVDTAAKFSAMAYKALKIPHPDLRTLVRMLGWSIFLVSSVFHPIVALQDERPMAYAIAIMQLCTSLFFIIPAWQELATSKLEWNAKRYKQTQTESAFRKKQNLMHRFVFFVLFLSCIPALAWVLAHWDEQSVFRQIIAIAFLMNAPFAYLGDFLWAAEPPKPDDGDTMQVAVTQPG